MSVTIERLNMNKEIWEKPKRVSKIGGEALLEGVMMRGQTTMASSVRKSSGEIVTEVKEYIPVAKRKKFLGLPFIRGSVNMIESMIVGVKVLMDSAEKIEFEEVEPESKFEKWLEKKLGSEKAFTVMLYCSVVFALIMGIGLFMLLPNLVADFIPINKETTAGAFYANIIEGIVRICFFLLYVYLVSKNKEIRRVFQYHGAEHKTIYAYENMEELTVENVKKHTTLHPRCGTTFIFVVILISIIVFAFAGWHSKLVNMAIRLAFLPVIAGISYEVLKLAAKSNSKLVKLISLPGIWLQKLTTKEPDDSMIEVAIASLKAVLDKESGEAAEQAV
jgi:uncharacterized protein YqhQ